MLPISGDEKNLDKLGKQDENIGRSTKTSGTNMEKHAKSHGKNGKPCQKSVIYDVMRIAHHLKARNSIISLAIASPSLSNPIAYIDRYANIHIHTVYIYIHAYYICTERQRERERERELVKPITGFA